MHESFFGLRKRPFLAVPTLERYFPVSSQELAVQSCLRAIQRAEGPVAVIGGTGLGKSMVCLRIVDTFRRSFEVILLDSSQICSRRALLQSLLFQLKMPYRELSEGELRLSLMDRMLSTIDGPADGFLLVVDEAQSLSAKLLEELRLITNMMRDGMPRVRLVLAGTMRLDEMLGHPQLESLNQRLACRSYLMPLTGPESAAYLTHKIELCGAPVGSVFTEDAIRLIHRATDGVPRLLDQVADQALRIAADARQRPVSSSTVEAAWAQLQQLPLPWSDSNSPISTNPSSTIEFGSLDDDGESEFASPSHTAFDKLKPNYFELAEQGVTPEFPSSSTESPLVEDDWSAFEPIQSSTGYTTKASESNATKSEENIASPIPSSGKGLGRVTASAIMANSIHDSSSTSSERPHIEPIYGTTAKKPAAAAFAAIATTVAKPSVSPTDTTVLFGDGFDEEMNLPTVPSSGSPVSATSTIDIVNPSSLYVDSLASFQDHRPSSSSLPIDIGLPIENLSDDEIEPYLDRWSHQASQAFFEVLDGISTANMEALTIDPSESFGSFQDVAPLSTINVHREMPATAFYGVETAEISDNASAFDGKLSSSRKAILSFAEMQSGTQSHHISDDRDLLFIEEEVQEEVSDLENRAKDSAQVHPYKQLFSKLRG